MGINDLNWTLLNSKHLIQDEWLSLRADTCQMPNGTIVEPYYVFEYPTWANIIALTPQRELVLVRQYRQGIQQSILELPGGSVNPEDSSPLAAAQRELLEETGYHCTHWQEVGKFSPNPASHNNYHYSYLGQNATLQQKQQLDETEEIEIVLKPLEEVFELIHSGQFIHTFHITSLFLAQKYLKDL